MEIRPEKPKIIFVYNADSGVFNLVSDIAHKIFSPKTYACNLCAITHSNFGMKKEWKEYLETFENPLEFLHADEFEKSYKITDTELPAIFLEIDRGISEIVNNQQINLCQSVDELKKLIEVKFKNSKV